MRHLVVSILFVFFWVCAPLAYGSEAAATFESWEPSSHALSLAQDVEATPLDRSRTAHLVQRFEHLVLDAKLAHQPTQQQIASALDASWVVASCWPTDLFDRRLQNPETDDLANLRAFFEDPATLTGVRARLGVLLTEYEVYAQAMSESLAKALCLPERQGAIIVAQERLPPATSDTKRDVRIAPLVEVLCEIVDGCQFDRGESSHALTPSW